MSGCIVNLVLRRRNNSVGISLDADFDNFYRSETRWGNIVACAGGISIFLACLGLFGLAALAAANRLKEIGIRRVLGASAMEIVGLLTGSFLPMVLNVPLPAPCRRSPRPRR